MTTTNANYRDKQEAAMHALEAHGKLSTTVPMMSDYANDDRLCLTAAAFLPQSLQEEIGNLIDALKEIEPSHYFYQRDSFHITVQNIRRISSPPAFQQRDIETAIAVLKKELSGTPPLDFELSGVLRLPTSMAIRAFGQPALLDLVRRTRRALEQAGLPDDKAYISEDVFFGNVTFCRYTSKPSPQFLAQAESLLTRFTKFVSLSEVHLISTNAACHPAFTTSHAKFVLHQESR